MKIYNSHLLFTAKANRGLTLITTLLSMKRLLFALSITVLLATLISGASTFAQPAYTPHENPVTARNSPDASALLASYGLIFDLTDIDKHQNALARLNQLENANIINQARDIVKRYNMLFQQLLHALSSLESILDEGSAMISRNQIDDAKEKFGAAVVANDDVRYLLKEIETVTNIMGDKIGVPTTKPNSRVKQDYKKLEQRFANLARSIAEKLPAGESPVELNLSFAPALEESVGVILRYIEELSAKKNPVALNLSFAPAPVFIGDSIIVSGSLTSGGKPLAKKELTLFLNSESPVLSGRMVSRYNVQLWNPAYLIDGNISTGGFHTDSADQGAYVEVDFGYPVELTGWDYYWQGGGGGATWDIECSSDGSSWSKAYTGLVVNAGSGWKTSSWTSAGKHRFWRSYKTNVAAGGVWHTELRITERAIEPLVTTTDFDGAYAARVTIPNKYVDTMSLKAEYIPSGNDIDTYFAGRSPRVVVNPVFYPTHLEVSAPRTAHPGLSTTISGQISSAGDNPDRTIMVLLDDTRLAEETTRGQFSLEITPPPPISMGKHSLAVVVTPQGQYSGITNRLSIDIERIPIQTEIQVPQLITITKPSQVSGKIYHNLNPIADAGVKLISKGFSSTTKTTTDGSFTTTIRPPRLSTPIDLSSIGPQELSITIEPVEPWYAPLQIKKWFLPINTANLGLMIIAFLSLGLLAYNQVRTRRAELQEERGMPQPQVSELPAITHPTRPKYEFTSIKGRILSAYTSGLAAVGRTTNIPMTAPTTLREFLKGTTPRLATAIKPFTELTTIAEGALYSSHHLDDEIATKAEQLATIIKEELHGETT